MHIEINKTQENLITLELSEEKLTQANIQQLEKTIEQLHKKTNDIHLIILLGPHTKVTLKMIYETLILVKKDQKNIHKIAVVAHSDFIKSGVGIDNMILPWEEKYFDVEDIDKAWQWVSHE